MGIKIDKISCSGLKRALQSASKFQEGYQENTHVELWTDFYENGGDVVVLPDNKGKFPG